MPPLRPLVVWVLLTLPVLLAACTLPAETEMPGQALEPIARLIDGLSPANARSHPVAMVLDPEGTRAFVALAGTVARPDARVAVVDLASGALEGHIAVGRRPVALVVDPVAPARALVVHPYQPSLTVLDLDTPAVIGSIAVPYYIEHVAFTPDGALLLAADRDQDRLIVYNVARDDDALHLEQAREIRTGPNPQWVTPVLRPGDERAMLAVVTDRHGGSVTIADLDTGRSRRLDIQGPPLYATARDGLVFVAGYGPGNGTVGAVDGTAENGTADIENSLLVLDLRGPVAEVLNATHAIPSVRYLSDTAHPERAAAAHRILAGAGLRHLSFAAGSDGPYACAGGVRLLATYHASDQVQVLCYRVPGGALTASVLAAHSGAEGQRMSHLDQAEPQTPGRLTDSVHAVLETPAGPRASALHGTLLLTVAEFPELVRVTDLTDCPGPSAPQAACRSADLPVVSDPRPYPDGLFEEGERLFHSALPSADQDRSCAACHIDGLATGGTWALPHRDLTPVKIPRLDDTADSTPWLLDGSVVRPSDYLNAAGGDLLRPDDTDPHNRADNNTTDRAQTPIPPIVRGRTNATAWMDATFAYALGESRLLPLPPRLDGTDAETRERGAALFVAPNAQCISCHATTDQALLLDAEGSATIPRPPGAQRVKAPPLAGLWDTTSAGLLWHGRATTLPAALLPDGHACLDGAHGLDEAWHGELRDRTCAAIADLAAYLYTLDGRR